MLLLSSPALKIEAAICSREKLGLPGLGEVSLSDRISKGVDEVQVVERAWKRSVENFFPNSKSVSSLPTSSGLGGGEMLQPQQSRARNHKALVCFSALPVLLLHFYLVTPPECLINVKSGSCHRSYKMPLSAHKSIRRNILEYY